MSDLTAQTGGTETGACAATDLEQTKRTLAVVLRDETGRR
jgi:hypothetical protein